MSKRVLNTAWAVFMSVATETRRTWFPSSPIATPKGHATLKRRTQKGTAYLFVQQRKRW